MTEYIPQTSATDRLVAARKALAEYDHVRASQSANYPRHAFQLAQALRALITPPGTGETVEQIADRLTESVMAYAQAEGLTERGIAMAGLRYGVLAGIQDAHETWEPEVAMRPTQEMMLRWLGIDYAYSEPNGISIHFQVIDREEI